MTHPVLAANETFAAWLAEGDVLAERRDSLNRQVLAAREADRRATEKHAAEVREAVESSKTIPPPPPPGDWLHLDGALAIQRQAEQEHQERRPRVLAQAHETGAWLGLEDRERGRLARLAPMLEEIIMIVAETQGDVRVARDLIAARDRVDGVVVRPSRADRINAKPSLTDVLQAAADGRSLYEPEPPQPRREQKIQTVGPDDDATNVGYVQAMAAQSRLGFQDGAGRFGNYDPRQGVPVVTNRGVEI
jgi:hypothetical protein